MWDQIPHGLFLAVFCTLQDFSGYLGIIRVNLGVFSGYLNGRVKFSNKIIFVSHVNIYSMNSLERLALK